MTELKILAGPIVRGEYEKLKEVLKNESHKDATLVFDYEPYCNIQSRQSLRTFKLLLDDPRFLFDDLFVARQLYFSSSNSRNLVMNHPKFRNVVNGRIHFTEYFYERYDNSEGTKVGMYQRFYQAERAIKLWRKENLQRLVFHLYPALIHYVRRFKQRYYAPEAPGFWKAKSEFEELALAS
jgi:hypothetical protein